jgi:hypothetical protein
MAYAKRNYGVKPHMLTSGGNVPPKRLRRKKVEKITKEFPSKSKQKSLGVFEKIRKALQ